MGRTMTPAGRYITRVNITTRKMITGDEREVTLVEVSSNLPLSFAKEEDNPEMRRVYALSFAISPKDPVYVDSGDVSFIFVHAGESVACFICSTPLMFKILPQDITPFVLEYITSFFEVCFLDDPIQVVTDFDNG